MHAGPGALTLARMSRGVSGGLGWAHPRLAITLDPRGRSRFRDCAGRAAALREGASATGHAVQLRRMRRRATVRGGRGLPAVVPRRPDTRRRIASHRLCRWLFSYSVNQRLRASAIRSKARTREADPSARANDQDCRHGVMLPVGSAWLTVMCHAGSHTARWAVGLKRIPRSLRSHAARLTRPQNRSDAARDQLRARMPA